jgi:alkylation response protein AidB-like acyl-CoA dehydrogenase
MDIDESAEDRRFRDGARSWLRENLPAGWDPNSVRTVGMEERLLHFGRSWERKLLDAGLNGISWPVKYGGRGGPVAHEMIFLEEATRCNVPESLNKLAKTMVGPALQVHGTEDQCRRFLPGMLDGTDIWCQGFSEPEAGSDLAGVRTRAEPTDGGWRVSGQKLWTSRAQHSDYCFALVRTDNTGGRGEREKGSHAGLSMMLIALAQDGVEIRPLRQANGDDEFNEVFFDGAFVPGDDVLGGAGAGWAVARTILSFERGITHFGRHVRLRRQVEELIARSAGIEVGGRPALLQADFRQRLAASLAEAEIYRLLAYRECAALERGAVGSSGSAVKLFWTEMWRRHQDLALEILGSRVNDSGGAAGSNDDEPISRYLSSLSRSIAGGTSEIQRSIVAERTLGLPRAARR